MSHGSSDELVESTGPAVNLHAKEAFAPSFVIGYAAEELEIHVGREIRFRPIVKPEYLDARVGLKLALN